jgi:hypothetical protein
MDCETKSRTVATLDDLVEGSLTNPNQSTIPGFPGIRFVSCRIVFSERSVDAEFDTAELQPRIAERRLEAARHDIVQFESRLISANQEPNADGEPTFHSQLDVCAYLCLVHDDVVNGSNSKPVKVLEPRFNRRHAVFEGRGWHYRVRSVRVQPELAKFSEDASGIAVVSSFHPTAGGVLGRPINAGDR